MCFIAQAPLLNLEESGGGRQVVSLASLPSFIHLYMCTLIQQIRHIFAIILLKPLPAPCTEGIM